MSPGIRENLLTPATMSNPCFGSVSPVPRVNNPGVPSKAGIGVHVRCWVVPSSSEALDAAVGGAAIAEAAPGSAAAVASGGGTSFFAFGSLAGAAAVAGFLSFGLSSSAKVGVVTKKRTIKNSTTPRTPNLIPPPQIACIDFVTGVEAAI